MRAQNDKVRRPGRGILVGLALLLLVAVPAGWSAIYAIAGFSGCFIECSEPDPAVGALWAGIAVFLLAIPITAGVVVARVSLARGWPWYLGVTAVLLLGAVYAQRVV